MTASTPNQSALDSTAPAEPRRIRPYHASLVTFHCFCGRAHKASDEVIRCQCGREWLKQEGDGGGR